MSSYSWPGGSGSGGSGVTSVGLVAPSSVFTVTGSPITSAGDLVLTFNDQIANTVFAGPTSGLANTPQFRALVVADIPNLPASIITSGLGNLTDVGTDGIVITGGTGVVIGAGTSIAQHVADSTHNGYLSSTDWSTFNAKQTAGNYITALTGDATAAGPGSAALTLATVNGNVGSFTNVALTVNAKGLVTAASSGTTGNLTDAGTDGIVITGGTGAVLGAGTSIAQHVSDSTHNGYLSSTDWTTFNGKGSVSSVTFTGDGTVLSSTPSSAVTTTGTLTATLNTQSANTFLAGPDTGGPSSPTFRAFSTLDFVAPTSQSFSAGTSGTYNLPTSPRTPLFIRVKMLGGGGGGAGTGAVPTTGNSGDPSTFGTSLLVSNGGSPPPATGLSPGGTGGSASLGTGPVGLAILGGYGQPSAPAAAATYTVGGGGGQNALGGAGGGGGAASAGINGVNSTGGGGGGAGSPLGDTSGAGGGAAGYVDALITSPLSSYSYVVGQGGSGGTAGAGGSAGGNGGDGLLLIEEYYQ